MLLLLPVQPHHGYCDLELCASIGTDTIRPRHGNRLHHILWTHSCPATPWSAEAKSKFLPITLVCCCTRTVEDKLHHQTERHHPPTVTETSNRTFKWKEIEKPIFVWHKHLPQVLRLGSVFFYGIPGWGVLHNFPSWWLWQSHCSLEAIFLKLSGITVIIISADSLHHLRTITHFYLSPKAFEHLYLGEKKS